MSGLTSKAAISGHGTIHWKIEVNGKEIDIYLNAFHIPSSHVRLLCPQQLLQAHPDARKIEILKSSVDISFGSLGTLSCLIDYRSNLPHLPLSFCETSDKQALHACVLGEKNQNLTPAQKELLKWHIRLGHSGFKSVQAMLKTGSLGWTQLIKSAANLDLVKNPIICGSCAFAKAKRKGRRTKRVRFQDDSPFTGPPPSAHKSLSDNVSFPGERVSMDHFIVTTPGRLLGAKGLSNPNNTIKGGVIFKDHYSGYIHIEPVLNFTAAEAIRAKQQFEQEMHSMGVTVVHYHTDNGVFTSRAFQDELAKLSQGLSLSGVGAHHQNAMAERAIGYVFSLARAQMLHAKLRWPAQIHSSLWPQALKHTQYLVNNLPAKNNVSPIDLILRSHVPRDHLRNLHTWGCPCYVLDPQLQDGNKVPKWQPRSRLGVHLGWSPRHASTVPLILNPRTGNISAQYHVVFDDWFATVSTDEKGPEAIDDDLWIDLLNDDRYQFHFDDDDPVYLDDEWLEQAERQYKFEQMSSRVRSLSQGIPGPTPINIPTESAPPLDRTEGAFPTEPSFPSPSSAAAPPTPALSPRTSLAPTLQREPAPQREIAMDHPAPTEVRPSAPIAPKPRKRRGMPDPFPEPSRPRARPSPGFFKQLANKGLCAAFSAMNYSSALVLLTAATMSSPFGQAALLGFDTLTDTFDEVDFHSYHAVTRTKFMPKKEDPDFPTYNQAMSRPDADEWIEAIDKEIQTLVKMNAWTVVPRSLATKMGKKVLPSTIALRLKRDPMGCQTKYEGRFCVRGDVQKRFEVFESYSPVVQWSTVRLMLILSIVYNLHTRQVDYVNAFCQSDINNDVFIELPRGYRHNNDVDCVLKLNKSLYGMSDAPLMFFEHLKKNLEDLKFKQLEHIDPCLFVHAKAICLTYVDDCLWFSVDEKTVDDLIKQMGKKMTLTVESKDVSAFLGIQFTRKGATIELIQTGLIKKIIAATNMDGRLQSQDNSCQSQDFRERQGWQALK